MASKRLIVLRKSAFSIEESILRTPILYIYASKDDANKSSYASLSKTVALIFQYINRNLSFSRIESNRRDYKLAGIVRFSMERRLEAHG